MMATAAEPPLGSDEGGKKKNFSVGVLRCSPFQGWFSSLSLSSVRIGCGLDAQGDDAIFARGVAPKSSLRNTWTCISLLQDQKVTPRNKASLSFWEGEIVQTSCVSFYSLQVYLYLVLLRNERKKGV